MSHYSQMFSVDFQAFLLKRRHLKNLKKSANKFVQIKNHFNDEKGLILTFNLSINLHLEICS